MVVGGCASGESVVAVDVGAWVAVGACAPRNGPPRCQMNITTQAERRTLSSIMSGDALLPEVIPIDCSWGENTRAPARGGKSRAASDEATTPELWDFRGVADPRPGPEWRSSDLVEVSPEYWSGETSCVAAVIVSDRMDRTEDRFPAPKPSNNQPPQHVRLYLPFASSFATAA